MLNKESLNLFKGKLDKGEKKEDITRELLNIGWTPESINEVFTSLESSSECVQNDSTLVKSNSKKGILFVVLALCALSLTTGAYYFKNDLIKPATTTPNLKSLCKDEICNKYFEIWKKEQMYQNKVTESYLNEHIIPESMKIQKWYEGESFYIVYELKIDWARARAADGFMIRTTPNNTHYPDLKIKRGEYLSQEEIREILNNGAFYSQFTWFTPNEKLFYKTKRDAVNAIRKSMPTILFMVADEVELFKVNEMEKTPEVLAIEKKMNELRNPQNPYGAGDKRGVNFPNPKAKQEMFLKGYDKSKCNKNNESFVVKLNLFTGDKESYKDTCLSY
jgi:hypothetical protein